MLLPESQAEQRNGQTQEPWTQRREERTCCSRSHRRSEAKWQTTTDRRDGTQNRSNRSRDAGALFQHAFPSRASTMARRTISTGGRPISAEPGYKRQLKANPFAWGDSPATSRPLMRIVGEPENARSVAMLSSLTSTSRTSAATPSESRTSLTSFTAAGWDGQSATYKTSALIRDLPFSCTAVLQDRAMSVLFAQLFIATAQRQLQFALQLLQVFQFVPNIGQLHFQAAAHGLTRLHPASPQIQKSSNFTKLESQTLCAPDEGQCFDITFAVTAKASLRPGRSGQQRIALIKTNRVNTQPNFLSDEANLHGLRSSLEATPWSIVQSQVDGQKPLIRARSVVQVHPGPPFKYLYLRPRTQ